jgi:hypothetical protein
VKFPRPETYPFWANEPPDREEAGAMGSLWQEEVGRGWRAVAVPAGRVLRGEEIGLEGVALFGLAQRGALLLVRPHAWVRVNGLPVLGGARVLEHKDEVLTRQGRACFSAESAPVVVPYRTPEGSRGATCPVCRGPIRDGMDAVQCPGCGRWFHQLDAKKCWTYAPTCRFCTHPTAFAAEAAWRPDREDDRG